MKKINAYLYITATALLIVLAGCSNDDHHDVVEPLSLEIQLNYDEEQQSLELPLENIEIKIKNTISGESYTAKTNASGLALFESIAPGNYSISVSETFSAEEYEKLTGITIPNDASFNASSDASLLENETLTLTLKAGRIGGLVFKQIYYAGSNAARGAAFRDQFIEIYNNSNETIYADSLYFGNTWSNNKSASDGEKRWDWGKSQGMSPMVKNPNDDYIYARYLFMIPGSGKDHPIESGHSIIIAQNAINHSAPYIDNSGKEQGITDPSLTIDLSNADFETYIVDYKREQSDDPDNFNPYRWDMDNPGVPNVDVVWFVSGQVWIMDALGREDFFMFKTTEDVSTWGDYPDPTRTSVDNTTATYKQIPVKYVLDAVEIKRIPSTLETPKRLPEALDGEGVAVEGGSYSSQSLIRKIQTRINDRIVLQDTNNSANDFETKQKADPSKTEESFTAY